MSERSLRQILEPLAAVPILTGLAYSIGVAYSSGLYQRVGLDNLDLLGFSVQTYVTRSYAAFDVFMGSIGMLTLAVCVLLAITGVIAMVTHRATGVVVASAAASVAWVVGDDRERLAIVISALAVGAVATFARDQWPWRTPALVGIALALWLAVTVGAEAAGRYQACRITEGSDFDTPLVRIVTDGPPYPGTRATPWDEIAGSSRVNLYDLRLFNTAPSGLIVYADEGPPSELIFLPIETILSVTSIPDGGNPVGSSGASC